MSNCKDDSRPTPAHCSPDAERKEGNVLDEQRRPFPKPIADMVDEINRAAAAAIKSMEEFADEVRRQLERSNRK